MRSSNAWTIKLWQQREWRLGFNSVFYNPNLFWSVSIYLFIIIIIYFILFHFFFFFFWGGGGGGGGTTCANHAWLTSRLMAYAEKKIFGVKVQRQTKFEGTSKIWWNILEYMQWEEYCINSSFLPFHPTCSTILYPYPSSTYPEKHFISFHT